MITDTLWSWWYTAESTSISWDMMVIVFLFLGIAVNIFLFGKNKTILFALGTYIGITVATLFPYSEQLGSAMSLDSLFIKAGMLYIGMFIAIFALMRLNIQYQTKRHRRMSVLQHSIISILSTGLLISATLTIAEPALSFYFRPFTEFIFMSGPAVTVWSIGTIVGLFFAASR